jgi:hypothetical protein
MYFAEILGEEFFMNRFEKILLTIFFVELFIGGGGRLIDFGFLSIRQVLFILLMGTFLFRIIKDKAFFNKEINTFIRLNPVTIGVYLLLGWFLVSSLIGFINGHSLSIIIMDLFRVIFFVAYFPLSYYISESRFSKSRVILLIKYSALLVAIFTITIDLLGKTVFSANFYPFYMFMNTIMNDDLFFRPSNSVFYKSHFFVQIGLIISLNAVLNKKYTRLDIANIILCAISVLWSETRGFLLAFMVSALVIIILDVKVIVDPIKELKNKIKAFISTKQLLVKTSILVLIIISVPFMYKYMTLERFHTGEENKPAPIEEQDGKKHKEREQINDVSVNTRMEFIKDSKDILFGNVRYLVVGTGYGMEIAGRVNGIEMTFLDILVEQGIIGLGVWLFLCLIVFYNYYSAYRQGIRLSGTDISLMAAFMGALLLTNINPFLNNPIGIMFFLIMLILSQNKKAQVKLQ